MVVLWLTVASVHASDQAPPPKTTADPLPKNEGQIAVQRPCNTPLDCPSDLKPGRGGGMLPDGMRPMEGLGGMHLDKKMELRIP